MYNVSINTQDKFAQIRPSISMVQEEFVKKEPEEYNLVDKQIIPLKKKVFVYQTIQSEKAKKAGIQKSCSRWHAWFYV